MPSQSSVISEPAFVSQQVAESRRYYLNLKPSPRAALSVVCGGVERMRPEYVVERQGFPFFAVEFVAEGRGTLMLKGRRFKLLPGTVFAYGPSVPHTIRNDPRAPMRKYYVDFAGTEAKRVLKHSPLGSWRASCIADIPSLVEAFESLAREANGDDTLTQSLCVLRLRVLMLKIRQIAVSGSRPVPRAFATYERIRTHVETHFLRLHTIDAIARECHVSPIHVSRLFHRFNRSGAYQFLIKLKMNRAAELLMNEGLLVKETAVRLGFPDAFQFSRSFKKTYGVPPSQLLTARWRRQQNDNRPFARDGVHRKD
jgi:AraC-like DNA-binding protein